MAASQALRQAREGRGSPTVCLLRAGEGQEVKSLSSSVLFFHSPASKTQQVQAPTYLVLGTPLKKQEGRQRRHSPLLGARA